MYGTTFQWSGWFGTCAKCCIRKIGECSAHPSTLAGQQNRIVISTTAHSRARFCSRPISASGFARSRSKKIRGFVARRCDRRCLAFSTRWRHSFGTIYADLSPVWIYRDAAANARARMAPYRCSTPDPPARTGFLVVVLYAAGRRAFIPRGATAGLRGVSPP
eukprot:SAG31_NODE_520_length_14616_cov_8.879005_10_plen_162_part_00